MSILIILDCHLCVYCVSINFALGHNKERRRKRKRSGKCHCCNNVCKLIILDCHLCVYCVNISFALGHNKGKERKEEKCGIAGENRPSGAKTQNELFIPCCSPYLTLSSGACGASICASVPEL